MGTQIHFNFALGRAYEAAGAFEPAAAALMRGNALKYNSFCSAPMRRESSFEAVRQTFSPALFERHANAGYADERPVFVVGMPRSGTTLVEQILSNHPHVYGAGEINLIARSMNSVMSRYFTPSNGQSLLGLDSDVFTQTAEAYVRELQKQAPHAKRIVNKLPDNYLGIGLIRLILPKATIIHCVRSPEATCLSLYKALFQSSEHQYAYDIRALVTRYRQYREIMVYWRETLPGFVQEVRYENLVSDQEAQTRRLIDLCGLDWSDDCLWFHKNTRRVTTASWSQVREPMHTRSVSMWENYRPYLPSLFEGLGAEAG